jgi:hypothetical protein
VTHWPTVNRTCGELLETQYQQVDGVGRGWRDGLDCSPAEQEKGHTTYAAESRRQAIPQPPLPNSFPAPRDSNNSTAGPRLRAVLTDPVGPTRCGHPCGDACDAAAAAAVGPEVSAAARSAHLPRLALTRAARICPAPAYPRGASAATGAPATEIRIAAALTPTRRAWAHCSCALLAQGTRMWG